MVASRNALVLSRPGERLVSGWTLLMWTVSPRIAISYVAKAACIAGRSNRPEALMDNDVGRSTETIELVASIAGDAR
jgi:hypothetical protein